MSALEAAAHKKSTAVAIRDETMQMDRAHHVLLQ